MMCNWKIRILIVSAALLLFFPILGTDVSADLAANGKYVVVLDPGHGGIDGGTDVGTLTEKEYDLFLAQGVRDALLADGRFEVYLTRNDNDTYLDMRERIEVGVEHHADLFVSLHCNSSPAPEANGLISYVSLVPEYCAEKVSDRMLDAMSAATGIGRGRTDTHADTGNALGVYYWNKDRQWDMPGDASLGMVSDYYSINTWGSRFGIPSMIMEHGYLTNAFDLACLDGAESRAKMAWAEASAIISYFTDHEHTWGPVTRDFPSNCVYDGTESSRCTICGCRNGVKPLPSAKDTDEGHYWRMTASEPSTCSTAGWAEYVCQISVSMSSKANPFASHTKREELPKAPHDLVTVGTTPASHGKDGQVVKRCQVCGEEVVEVIPGEEHTFEPKKTVEPTCTEAGYTVEKCSVCGETRKVTGDPPRHKLGEDGVCEVCGVTVTSVYPDGEIDPDCEHEWEPYEIPPTCLEDGRTGRECSRCGVCEYIVVTALGHEFEVRQSVEPTCISEGLYRAECIRCGEIDEETFPMKEHIFGEQRVNGKRRYVCLFCGEPDPNAPTGSGTYSVYEVGAEAGSEQPEQPESEPEQAERPEPQKDGKKKPNLVIPVLAIAILLIAAGVPVWIYLSNKKYEEEQTRLNAFRTEPDPEDGWRNSRRTASPSNPEAKALRLAQTQAAHPRTASTPPTTPTTAPAQQVRNAASVSAAAASVAAGVRRELAESVHRTPNPAASPASPAVRRAQNPQTRPNPQRPIPAQPAAQPAAQANAAQANAAQANPQLRQPNPAQANPKPKKERVLFNSLSEEEYERYERYARAVQAARFARQAKEEAKTAPGAEPSGTSLSADADAAPSQ